MLRLSGILSGLGGILLVFWRRTV